MKAKAPISVRANRGRSVTSAPELPAGDYEMVVEIGGAASQPVLLKVM
jgi:hypothetical protein